MLAKWVPEMLRESEVVDGGAEAGGSNELLVALFEQASPGRGRDLERHGRILLCVSLEVYRRWMLM